MTPDEQRTYYSVLRITTVPAVFEYQGQFIRLAAQALEPGTVYGKGATQDLADANALENASVVRAATATVRRSATR
ncbi:MAG TPA: hypothetical protein VG713_06735 [Pirellulales bacterium]|nr:hypothetical protein [Pirellulales bacterium]